MDIQDYLKNVSLFHGLTEEEYHSLSRVAQDQVFEKGETIFSEGDPGLGFYVVIDGFVKIYKLSMEGKEQILHLFEGGEPFAEAAVFSGASYPAHAQALKKSRVFFFPRSAFMELIQKQPALAMNMMAALSLRLKKFSSLIEALSLKEVPGRLATHILYLSGQHNSAATVELKVAKNHLASLLGTIPETLSRILTKMNNQGLISSQGSYITIRDREGLIRLAEGESRL